MNRRVFGLFLMGTLISFVAKAADGGSAAGADAAWLKLLESGTVGATYAAGTWVALRTLFLQVIKSKNDEIEAKDAEIKRWHALALEAQENQAKVARALADMAEAVGDMKRFCASRAPDTR